MPTEDFDTDVNDMEGRIIATRRIRESPPDQCEGKTLTLGVGQSIQILARNKNRARALIEFPATGDIAIGSRQKIQGGAPGMVGVAVIEITSTGEVWARNEHLTEGRDISVWEEYYSSDNPFEETEMVITLPGITWTPERYLPM